MRNAIRFGATVLFSFAPVVTASAQVSETRAEVLDYRTVGYVCVHAPGPQAGSTNSLCQTGLTDGFGIAASGSFNSTRFAYADSRLIHYGPDFGMAASAIAYATQSNSIFVNGTSGASDQLVFHFAMTRDFRFTGSPGGSMQSAWEAILNTSTGSPFVGGLDTPTASFTSSSGPGYTATIGGADFTVGFGTISGTFAYDFRPYVHTYLNGDQPQDAFGAGSLDMRLNGIDAVDANGVLLARAVFGQDGNATLDLLAAPEPGSLVLVATGLVAVLGAGIRRRATS